VTRRPGLVLAAVLAIAIGVVTAIIVTRSDDATTDDASGGAPDGLTLLVVRTAVGPFAAVIGSTGGDAGALAVPAKISVTVPGQGDARLDEALDLPAQTATTTVSNALGLWIDHHASLGRLRLAALVDRIGGLEIGGRTFTGDEVVASIEDINRGRSLAFQLALQALLEANPAWIERDFDEVDDLQAVTETLGESSDATVTTLEIVEPAEGIFRAEPAAIHDGVVEAFGGPDRELVPVIVLNGSGAPGVGEAVAERIVPGGFSVVVSENAQTFDHDETLVVVGSSSDVGLGGRVRDLLGVGAVNVSVSSGLAPVTIVVGKDFGG
jgi:hypothetical protein